MIWYLKIAFGESEILFGGTVLNASMGLGQRNGATPLCFLAVCTLMISVYQNLGHGVLFIGACARDPFTLCVVVYVDESNLFHVAISWMRNFFR
jgi:hypothetical protein